MADLEDILRAVERIDDRTERIEAALFVGNGAPPVLSRLTALETRGAPSKTERGGVLGTAVGAAVIAVLAYFGVRPGGQQ